MTGLMRSVLAIFSRVAALLIECLIRFYQVSLRPLLSGSCKFIPSCSEYFIQAVHEWGVIRGSWLGIKRLLRCRPFTVGGFDPVPRRAKRGSGFGVQGSERSSGRRPDLSEP